MKRYELFTELLTKFGDEERAIATARCHSAAGIAL